MKNKHYLGIDCGLDGAFTLIDNAGNIVFSVIMPTIKLGKGRAIDIEKCADIMADARFQNAFAMIEDPGGHAPSASGLRSMTYSFAVIETIARLQKLSHSMIMAWAWQREFWGKPKMANGVKFDTKAQARQVAKQLWPESEWLASERCKKPHDGMIDAALIAEFARRKSL